MTIEFFDCNCSIGSSARPAFRYASNAVELIEEMNFCGIDRALVHHAGMRFGHPAAWNLRLLEEIRGIYRLEPVWTILPSQTGEQLEPEEFLKSMKVSGVKVLWAFPQEHHYLLDSCTFKNLIDILVEKRIPLFVKDNILVVSELIKEFPNLIVVAVNQGPHSLERYLRPLVERYHNLYLDTSYCIVEGLIEEFCKNYGADRLLFSSGFPDNCSGGALLCLIQADIDDDAKRKIAGKNLERLLAGVRL